MVGKKTSVTSSGRPCITCRARRAHSCVASCGKCVLRVRHSDEVGVNDVYCRTVEGARIAPNSNEPSARLPSFSKPLFSPLAVEVGNTVLATTYGRPRTSSWTSRTRPARAVTPSSSRSLTRKWSWRSDSTRTCTASPKWRPRCAVNDVCSASQCRAGSGILCRRCESVRCQRSWRLTWRCARRCGLNKDEDNVEKTKDQCAA
jgi:hypothetical protein